MSCECEGEVMMMMIGRLPAAIVDVDVLRSRVKAKD